MKTYKYITDEIVAVIDEDGVSRMSGLASTLVPDGVTPEPADPAPTPEPEKSLADQILDDPAELAKLKKALGL